MRKTKTKTKIIEFPVGGAIASVHTTDEEQSLDSLRHAQLAATELVKSLGRMIDDAELEAAAGE